MLKLVGVFLVGFSLTACSHTPSEAELSSIKKAEEAKEKAREARFDSIEIQAKQASQKISN